jgi:hypothetical protein
MLRSRTLLTGRGSVSDWTGTVNEGDLLGEHWMLVYEGGIRKSWGLPGAEAAVGADPHFRVLRDHGISFFNTTATNVALELPTIDRLLEARLSGRRSAVLPGTIHFETRMPRSQRRYEKLGDDYGTDDEGWAFLPRARNPDPDSDDQIPF